MTQENVDALRALYEEWARGNFRAGLDLLDPDVLLVLRPEFPDAGIYVGTESASTYMRGFLAAWAELTIAAEEFIEAEGSVVVAVHQRGLGRESGVAAEMRYFTVWTFRGRRAIRLEQVRDRAEALEAVGLSE